MKIDLLETLRIYGTAGGLKRPVIVEKQLYFKGFERFSNAPVGYPPANPLFSGTPATCAGKRTFKAAGKSIKNPIKQRRKGGVCLFSAPMGC